MSQFQHGLMSYLFKYEWEDGTIPRFLAMNVVPVPWQHGEMPITIELFYVQCATR